MKQYTRSNDIPLLTEYALGHITSEVPFVALTTVLQQRLRIQVAELQSELRKRKRQNVSIKVREIEVARTLGDALNIFYEREATPVPDCLLAEIARRGHKFNGEFFAFDVLTYIHEGLYYEVWPYALDANVFAFVVYRGLSHFVILNQVWGAYVDKPSDDMCYYTNAFAEKTLSAEVRPTIKYAMMVGRDQ